MPEPIDFQGYCVFLCRDTPTEPIMINDEPFTLGALTTILCYLLNGASDEEWQQTRECFEQVFAPGDGAVAQCLKSDGVVPPYDEELVLDFCIMGGVLMPPAQGTLVILRKAAEFTHCRVDLVMNPLKVFGKQNILDDLSNDLHWAAALSGYNLENANRVSDQELGATLSIISNEKTHCCIRVRSSKPLQASFWVQNGAFAAGP